MEFEQMLVQEAAREARDAREVAFHTTAPIAKKFDTKAVLADLTAMETKCIELVNEANALQITTAEENAQAVNISGGLQELFKKVKKKCEDFLEPHKKVISVINSPKKRIIEAATRAKSIINQKIFQFKKQEEINQAKQQQRIDEATEKLQESLKEQAEELGIEAPTVAPIKAPKPATVIRGDSGASVYTTKRWKCEIVNEKEIPREYCLASMPLLNQAVKMGKRNIPGTRIWEDEKPATRTG